MGAYLGLWLFFQGLTVPPGVKVQDEGTTQGQAVTLNCTGAGVSCSVSGGVATLTSSGGGAGSANVVEVEVDFGSGGDTSTSTVVTGQAWVGATSVIVCAPTLLATADRAEGAEDAIIEGLTVAVHSRVAATGFTVAAGLQQGKAYGKFKVHCTGA